MQMQLHAVSDRNSRYACHFLHFVLSQNDFLPRFFRPSENRYSYTREHIQCHRNSRDSRGKTTNHRGILRALIEGGRSANPASREKCQSLRFAIRYFTCFSLPPHRSNPDRFRPGSAKRSHDSRSQNHLRVLSLPAARFRPCIECAFRAPHREKAATKSPIQRKNQPAEEWRHPRTLHSH